MKQYRVSYRIITHEKYWVGMESNLNQGGGISRREVRGADKSVIVNAESADDAAKEVVNMVAIEWKSTARADYEAEILEVTEA